MKSLAGPKRKGSRAQVRMPAAVAIQNPGKHFIASPMETAGENLSNSQRETRLGKKERKGDSGYKQNKIPKLGLRCMWVDGGFPLISFLALAMVLFQTL